MNRCPKAPLTAVSSAVGALLISAGLLLPSPSWAARDFPKNAQRAEMTFVALPDVLIDGQPERLDHSARIYSERNSLLVPHRVNGRTAIVNYQRQGRDGSGKVRQVWILTPEEVAKPAPNTPNAVKSNFGTSPNAAHSSN
jgi:hypothetical protein